MDLGLKDKAAFVAASSRGLGGATARQLAREGARVAINARDVDKLEAAAVDIRAETGSQVVTVPGDVASAADSARLVDEAVRHLGGLDVLVTNTGGPPAGRFEDFDDEAWLKAVDLQFMSAVRLIRAALPHLRRSASPAVLTITSISTKSPIANLVLSSSVRMAVIGLTKSLALELGGEGIRFNSILPATVRTPRIQFLFEDRARRNGTTVEEEAAKQASAASLGRIAEPQEFANVAAFLCSPAASYVTGVMLNFDGGTYKAMY
jgi:3-oxoacyl-[acyl-carrier protein] reductase